MKEKKWTVPGGLTGKVSFTPTLRCTKGERVLPISFCCFLFFLGCAMSGGTKELGEKADFLPCLLQGRSSVPTAPSRERRAQGSKKPMKSQGPTR